MCSRNKWRSATAETIYKNSQEHRVKSAGTEPSAVQKVSEKMIQWADLIFAFEKKHKERLQERFGDALKHKHIVFLDIADDYTYMDEELVNMIQLSVEPYLNN